MPTADTRWKTWMNLLLGLALTFLFFYMMAPFVVAFLLGAVIAIIANPLNIWFRRRCPRGVAAGLTTSAITLLILIPLGGLLISGSHRLLKIIGDLKATKVPLTFTRLDQAPWLKGIANTITKYLPVDRDWVRDQALDILQTLGEAISKVIGQSLAAMPSALLAFFVVTISVFCLLKDGERFLAFLESLSPSPGSRSRELFRAFETSCRGVVLSLLASALVQGMLMTFFSLISGLKNPVLLGLLTVAFGMVPIVGAAPVWMGAAIYLFAQGQTGWGIFMLVGGAVITASDNVVRPLILKGHSQMHPLLALVSVFGAINLVGATGIFLGPIVAAVFVSFLKILSMENQRGREIGASQSLA